jgi:hypothetical protein
MKVIFTILLSIFSIHAFTQLSEAESAELKTLLKKFKKTHDDFYNFDSYQHKQATSGLNKHSMYPELRDTALYIIVSTTANGSLFLPNSATVKMDSTFYVLSNPVNTSHLRVMQAVNETMHFTGCNDLVKLMANYTTKQSVSIRISNNDEYRDGSVFVKNIIAWSDTYRLYQLLKKKA